MCLFHLVQFTLILDNPKQLTFEELTHCLHSEHHTPKNITRINFPNNNISL